jgi:chromosome segregation ATPase
VATEGGESPAVDAPGATDVPQRSAAPGDADDVVITTVVAADDNRPPAPPPADQDPAGPGDDLGWVWDDADEAPERRPPPAAPVAPPTPAAPQPAAPQLAGGGQAVPPQLAALEERLAVIEAVPATVDTLGKAIRHELERCANVLFGHDRALSALAARLDAAEAAAASSGDPTVDAMAERARMAEETVVRVLAQVERMDQRIVAMETRVQPLEPLPTVVGALRRAVRASDDLLAGETAAREQALVALAGQQATEAQSRDDALRRLVAQDLDRVSAVSTAQAKGLADIAERLSAVEGRLAPLDSVPEDIAALSRILRRELDAIVTDNQARDQMLRRALQNEIDQLRTTSEAREELSQALTTRLDALEARSAESAVAAEAATGAAGVRLDILETRIVAVDRIGAELDALGETVRKELDHLRSGGQAHDQVAGELTRRLSALDARLARLDPVPGEVQSLRTAMLQEAERTVSSLRAAEERLGQLAWVPGEFQEARKRIMALTSGVQAGQDRVRQLEAALVSLSERLEGLRARLATPAPPGPPG